MDSMAAYALGQANYGKTPRVFDWDEAARRIKASGATDASAGLSGDWEWTGGEILRDGKPVDEDDTYVYLASVWAHPELDLGDGAEDCWCYRPDWDAHTYWPESALRILAAER